MKVSCAWHCIFSPCFCVYDILLKFTGKTDKSQAFAGQSNPIGD